MLSHAYSYDMELLPGGRGGGGRSRQLARGWEPGKGGGGGACCRLRWLCGTRTAGKVSKKTYVHAHARTRAPHLSPTMGSVSLTRSPSLPPVMLSTPDAPPPPTPGPGAASRPGGGDGEVPPPAGSTCTVCGPHEGDGGACAQARWHWRRGSGAAAASLQHLAVGLGFTCSSCTRPCPGSTPNASFRNRTRPPPPSPAGPGFAAGGAARGPAARLGGPRQRQSP